MESFLIVFYELYFLLVYAVRFFRFLCGRVWSMLKPWERLLIQNFDIKNHNNNFFDNIWSMLLFLSPSSFSLSISLKSQCTGNIYLLFYFSLFLLFLLYLNLVWRLWFLFLFMFQILFSSILFYFIFLYPFLPFYVFSSLCSSSFFNITSWSVPSLSLSSTFSLFFSSYSNLSSSSNYRLPFFLIPANIPFSLQDYLSSYFSKYSFFFSSLSTPLLL